MAVVSAFGDAIWFEMNLPHRTSYGLAHGALLCAAIGAYLGALTGRVAPGAGAGAAIGLAAAATYYLLAPFTGPGVMLAVWMALWVALAALYRWLRVGACGGRMLQRGVAAAVLFGAAFYAISGVWFHHEGPRNYAVHFASWMLPYAAAFLAVFAPVPNRREGVR
jgi:hypothetical protein